MKVLFLAPQPFFQERGTPIAVRLALETLAERFLERGVSTEQDSIDLLVYHEGEDVEIPGVNVKRIYVPWPLSRMLTGLRPGPSIKKLLCDFLFFIKVLALCVRQRRHQYDLVHAVEEAAFMAILVRFLFGIPYIYDMDSSLSLQLTEKWRVLKPLRFLFERCERLAIKSSVAVAPVCDALAVLANRSGSSCTVIVRDVSLLGTHQQAHNYIDLRTECGAARDEIILLYVGNLEHYQGIDLLLEALKLLPQSAESWRAIVIGGIDKHVREFQKKAAKLALNSKIFFIGARPLGNLAHYISQADILLSPRLTGNNTPMKIYSYMHSGKAILATDLPTHTQVMDKRSAVLVKPDASSLAQGLLALIESRDLRNTLGKEAKRIAEERYTFDKFRLKLNELYDEVGGRIEAARVKASVGMI